MGRTFVRETKRNAALKAATPRLKLLYFCTIDPDTTSGPISPDPLDPQNILALNLNPPGGPGHPKTPKRKPPDPNQDYL